MNALGLIEVKGYLTAVKVADVTLKAANVTLINLEKIRGGYVTVQITGDVGAVQAAVDAVAGTEQIISSHVIARMHQETKKIIKKCDVKMEDTQLESKQNTLEKEQPPTSNKQKGETIISLETNSNDFHLKLREDLEKLTVNELRKKVRENKNIEASAKMINYARKDTLIDILLKNERKDDGNVDGS